MKRLLISALMTAALGFAGHAAADDYRGHGYPPGIQKQLERGKPLPPGLQKKYMHADWRDRGDRHDRHYSRDHDRKYWEKRQKARYKQEKYREKQRQKYREKYWSDRDRHDRYRYRDGYRDGYRTSYGYDDRLPPEHRVARIIRDTQAIIEQTR